MNTITKTRNIFAGLVLASSGLLATGASAATITAWDWRTDGGFVTAAGTCSNGPTTADCNLMYDNTSGVTPSTIGGTASVMTWGTGITTAGGNGEQSGLQGVFGASGTGPYDAQLLGSGTVNIPEFEQIITNGGWTNTGAAVHYNNVISVAGGNMETSTLRTSFQLLTPAAGPINLADLEIEFNETPNVSGCPFGAPHGTVCDDIFTLTGSLDPVVFYVDSGKAYKAQFRLASGPGAIVDGNVIYTAEDSPGTAVMYVQGRIDTIPLPGVLALMGMGLMMIGWRVRSRKLV